MKLTNWGSTPTPDVHTSCAADIQNVEGKMIENKIFRLSVYSAPKYSEGGEITEIQ